MKTKLKRFAAMSAYPNVVEPSFEEVFRTDYRMKGRWKEDFFGNGHPLVLELGCGKGEYTVALARKYPEKNFIGMDIKGARMWVGATDALQNRLNNAAFLRSRIEFILSCFAPGEVSEIWITFPDPQPQQSRLNKRLTSVRFLESYRTVLRPSGLIHLKTDSDSLFEYTRRVLLYNRLPVRWCTPDLYQSALPDEILSVQTCYEKMFMAKGFSIKYLQFTVPAGSPLREPEEKTARNILAG
ncbi:MAG: tRNA (guanosine(46)-N7)-methyltransferase TrmB [Bacteroidales bacterium]|jgi:tRNA (guanine-N7-)-methyltransferase|nr:tRNA (guanosine(46)-N7)-methyltransferase TrmB [Bacteroidales bacterium]